MHQNSLWEHLPFLIFFLINSAVPCPELCVCKWKSGKQTVECGDRGLHAIPEGMDASTQVLDFTGNNLQWLRDEEFSKLDLINLQRIYLSRGKISTIENRAFYGLTNLVELDLSENLLEDVPTEIFFDCRGLMRLSLNRNPIKAIKRESFNHLSYLNTLELSNCDICVVEDGAFIGLNSLEWLHLDGNKINTLAGDKVLPGTLKGVELQDNLWDCDCNMLELNKWLLDFNIPLTVQPTCSSPPRLRGKLIKMVPTEEFACLPEVAPTDFYIEVDEGKNISLICYVKAVPEARISWSFRGSILKNDTLLSPGLRLYYFFEYGGEEKQSELFIYNTRAEDNGSYVCNAENIAGAVKSNFSVRIILKEEPVKLVVSFPYEYILAAMAGCIGLLLALIIGVGVVIVKCKKSRKRQEKREKTKEVALQYQESTTKASLFSDSIVQIQDSFKPLCENSRDEVVFYDCRSRDDLLRATSPLDMSEHISSPSRRYQLEQNPDLINDTEALGRRKDGDGFVEENCSDKVLLNRNVQISGELIPSGYQVGVLQSEVMPNGAINDFFQNAIGQSGLIQCGHIQASVSGLIPSRSGLLPQAGIQSPAMQNGITKTEIIQSGVMQMECRSGLTVYNIGSWNPSCRLDSEGYPEDYGLPKVHQGSSENYYRTLPHNRISKRQGSGVNRYSREVEFYPRLTKPSLENYRQDIRYTADGYPVKNETQVTLLSSPLEGYECDTSAPSSLTCCNLSQVQWPACLPANVHVINPGVDTVNQSRYTSANKRCIGAQTEYSGAHNQQIKCADDQCKNNGPQVIGVSSQVNGNNSQIDNINSQTNCNKSHLKTTSAQVGCDISQIKSIDSETNNIQTKCISSLNKCIDPEIKKIDSHEENNSQTKTSKCSNKIGSDLHLSEKSEGTISVAGNENITESPDEGYEGEPSVV